MILFQSVLSKRIQLLFLFWEFSSLTSATVCIPKSILYFYLFHTPHKVRLLALDKQQQQQNSNSKTNQQSKTKQLTSLCATDPPLDFACQCEWGGTPAPMGRCSHSSEAHCESLWTQEWKHGQWKNGQSRYGQWMNGQSRYGQWQNG